jgi:integrase/recombinase XerC
MDTLGLTEFGRYLAEGDRSRRTVAGYVDDIKHFSRWFEQRNGEALQPANLTPTDVKQYRAYLQNAARAKPATINRRLAALRAYGAAAVELGRAKYNPVNGIRGAKEQKLAPKWLSKGDKAKLEREAERRCQNARTEPARRQAIRDKAILALLLNTGLRIGELSELQMGDITMSERKGELRVRGKGDKERIIPLNANVRKALQEWYAVRLETRSLLVFIGQKREGLKRRAIQAMLEELGTAAKVEGVSPHVLRHTFAKDLVDMGVSLEKVAMLLGHANLNTTKIYITPGMGDLEAAVKTLEN